MKKSEYLTNHYRSLRDRAFAQWQKAEVVASKKATRLGIEIQADAPVYWLISEEIDSETKNRALDHLRSKKYKDGFQCLLETERLMREHNEKVQALVQEVERGVRFVLSKFPTLGEMGTKEEWYFSPNVIGTVESGVEVTSSENEVYGGKETLAYVEDELTRTDFMGELHALLRTYKSQFEEARSDHSSAIKNLSDFKTFITGVMKKIDASDKLEGECEVERGKFWETGLP